MLDQDFSKPIYNALFLIPCIGLVHYRNLSASDLGLKVVIERIGWHAAVCFFLFIIYMLFYLFVGRISSLRPISAKTWEGF